jgi:2OG-Fe(II) oxygenase superfamily
VRNHPLGASVLCIEPHNPPICGRSVPSPTQRFVYWGGRYVLFSSRPQLRCVPRLVFSFPCIPPYRTHHDYIPHQRTRSCGPRILTFLFYLSDVASGGETNFPDLGLTIQPKKGRAVLFANVMDSGEPTPGKRGVWLFCNVSVFAHRALCVGGVRGSPIIGPLLTSTRNDVPCFCKNRHVIRFGFPTHGSRIVVRSLGGRSADAPPGPAGGNRHQICRQCL